MGISNTTSKNEKDNLANSDYTISSRFVKWAHPDLRVTHCFNCVYNDRRIFEKKNSPPIGKKNHLFCECYYEYIRQKAFGTISNKGAESPDIYLKVYGRLPDYYVTKQEAEEIYGWDSSKNTLAGKAPGKMIGGDIYGNIPPFLPEKDGRIWRECDIDYTEGRRNMKRLYYSSDGLMFYSPDHGITFYYIN